MLGSQVAMPILVLNMGGEMIYILHQRLNAQNIPEEKAKKVLEDVIRTMYTPVFLDELFKPQEMYSNASTKQIFDKLAHSSIMRLNKTSMEKLYDLMTMGVKYQLLSAQSPQQYLQITINHLESLIHIVDHSESVTPLIRKAIEKSIQMYSQLSYSNWILLEQTLMQFFQGRKVKVSLFLQNNLQTVNGVLILNNKGVLPFLTEKPGQIRYYEGDKFIRSTSFPSDLRDHVHEGPHILDITSSLGKNMYTKSTGGANTSQVSDIFSPTGPSKPTASMVEALDAMQKSDSYTRMVLAKDTSYDKHQVIPSGGQVSSNYAAVSSLAMAKGTDSSSSSSGSKFSAQVSAKAELNLLADLLGGASSTSADSKSSSTHFKINLFSANPFNTETNTNIGNNDEDDENYDQSYIRMDVIDASASAKDTMQRYLRALNLNDDDEDRNYRDSFYSSDVKGSYSDGRGAKGGASKGVKGADDEDDLLALMDSVK